MQKIWKIKEPDIARRDLLVRELEISRLFAQLLVNRGIGDAAAGRMFLESELKDLYDPFLMKGMRQAVDRLTLAIDRKEKVFIATDFDVDGVTSCAILEAELKRRGVPVAHYLPHRLKDGYGLNADAVALGRDFGAKIFISLDCGITAREEVGLLRHAGIDVIIIDHHEPPDVLPEATSILNPKQKDCSYPFRDLASVGLVFKLIQAFGAEDLFDYLDLVALGTVADVAPLISENRIFVRHGLDVLNRTKRAGLKSLIDAAGIGAKKISTHSISFMLAPRLNASGRIDSAHTSLDLLLSDDAAESKRLAGDLNEHNRSRQQLEGRVLEQAMEQIDREVNFDDDFIIVLSHEDWHPGVLGIVASKIVDRYYRPAIVISLQDGVGRGSARSVPNFHIYEALCRCGSFLTEFGGHKYAAGLTIRHDNIKEFKKVLNAAARDCFRKEAMAPVIEADAQIPMGLANEDLMRDIDRLSPYGEGNRRPIFISRNLLVKSCPSVVGRNTLKFRVSEGEGACEAVGFGLGDLRDLASSSSRVDLAYSLGWDEWNQDSPVQLEIKDIKASV